MVVLNFLINSISLSLSLSRRYLENTRLGFDIEAYSHIDHDDGRLVHHRMRSVGWSFSATTHLISLNRRKPPRVCYLLDAPDF